MGGSAHRPKANYGLQRVGGLTTEEALEASVSEHPIVGDVRYATGTMNLGSTKVVLRFFGPALRGFALYGIVSYDFFNRCLTLQQLDLLSLSKARRRGAG